MPLTCGRDQSSLVQRTEEELVDAVPHLNKKNVTILWCVELLKYQGDISIY